MAKTHQFHHDQFIIIWCDLRLIGFKTLLPVTPKDYVLGLLFEALIWASNNFQRDSHIVPLQSRVQCWLHLTLFTFPPIQTVLFDSIPPYNQVEDSLPLLSLSWRSIGSSVPELSSLTASNRGSSFDKVPVEPMLVEIVADCGMIPRATGASIAEADAELNRLTLFTLIGCYVQ